MLKSEFDLRVFRNTPENMAIAQEIAMREMHNEFHILMNKKKIALVTHLLWDNCEYCNYEQDEFGIIDLN